MEMCTKTPDDLGGCVRICKVAELIRRGAPLHLRFGLFRAPGIHPYGTHTRGPHSGRGTAPTRARPARRPLGSLNRLLLTDI
jgi:hypothetical protein